MSPPGRDVAQITLEAPSLLETRPCKFCKCEVKLYLVDYDECELCRICIVLGHEFLNKEFPDLLDQTNVSDRLAWKVGEYVWMHKDGLYQDAADRRKKLKLEIDRSERDRRLVALIDEAGQIKKDAPTLEVVLKCFGNIFEDMTKILREEYPNEQNEDQTASDD